MKNILLIGGSSGIGNALLTKLENGGHTVFPTFNSTPLTHDNAIQLDVADVTSELDSLPDTIDGLVYCPGSINLMPFQRIKPTDFVKDYEVQVVGAINIIQKVLSRLKKGVDPSIVLFSTVAVQHGFNFHSQVSASKGAIEGLVRALAAEFAPKVRINAIAPSITNTPLASKLLSSDEKIEANAKRHPLHKVGEPDDIASMAAFLLSEEAKWITGQIITIDGGISRLKV